MIKILKADEGMIKVIFPYNPVFVEKIKTISGLKWHPEGKYWSSPNPDGTLEKILKVFEGEEIYIDPALKPKELHHNFEDLRRELISRKYSYKTIKAYIYFNRDFLNFVGKNPSDITDNDIKNYLVYLAEKKQVATSTSNQAINALKFYYGAMLKKKLFMRSKDLVKIKNYQLY